MRVPSANHSLALLLIMSPVRAGLCSTAGGLQDRRCTGGKIELSGRLEMKTTTSTAGTTSRPVAGGRRSQPAPSDYASAAETHALLADSLASRQRRLEAADIVSTDEAGALVGTSRVTINA